MSTQAARTIVLASVTVALLVPALASALPTPGANGPAFEAAYGRLFPEALQTNDYVSYDEAVASLALLNERHPDLMEYVVIGQSVGWPATPDGPREPRDLFAVEVTNEKSDVPAHEKLTTVFFLSIHGNEKGGREGGFRAIEDLVAGLGIAQEDPELVPMLDYQRLVFIFANTDGWTHEELQYRHADACYLSVTCGALNEAGEPGAEPANFVRVNGNGTDLNRQLPTVGYMAAEYATLAEPEARGMAAYAKNLTNVVAGADIHGMLNHDYYYMIMLKDGQRTQQEIFENEALAELLKERINSNPYYAAWQTSPHVDDVGGGQFAEWSSTIDAIGYSAQGTAGAFIVQNVGLNAPGFTVEMAYNHIVADNYYPGAGATFNDYHVRAMRDTVMTFMHFAAERIDLSVDTAGARIGVLATANAVSSEDDDATKYEGWMTQTTLDDAFDIAHVPFTASPTEYWTDLARFARTGDTAAVFDLVDEPGDLLGNLASYDVVVVPGSAARKLATADLAPLRAWVEAGGRLVLTDEALQLLAPLDVVDETAIKSDVFYSGYTDLVDREHAWTKDLRGSPRQTFDPNPLGFAPDQSPGWYVTGDSWDATGGHAVGIVGRGEAAPCAIAQVMGQCIPPVEDARVANGLARHLPAKRAPSPASAANGHEGALGVNLGEIPLGDGTIAIFGAILPDPLEDVYHPYGLEGYAVSAGGNAILLNMLGLTHVYSATPAVDEAGEVVPLAGRDEAPVDAAGTGTQTSPNTIPTPSALLALAVALAVALARAARRPRA